jgi:hypothetical protein
MIGFGWALRVTAFLVLFLMIVANFTIHSRMPPFKKPVNIFEFFHPFKELPFDLVAVGSFCFFLGMFLPINYIMYVWLFLFSFFFPFKVNGLYSDLGLAWKPFTMV